jgi:hypothetical protein
VAEKLDAQHADKLGGPQRPVELATDAPGTVGLHHHVIIPEQPRS